MNSDFKNVKTFRIAELIYFLYFSVMTLTKGLGLYEGMWPFTVALWTSTILILIKLSLTKHTIAEWLYIFSMLALSILIWKNSGQTGILMYATMIIALKNVSVKHLFSLGIVLWGGTFVLQTILTLTGIRPDIFVIHEKLGLGFIIRWSLGQPHPNVLQITFLIICAMILYLTNLKGRKLLIATAIMFVANMYVFFYSVSYTGLILVIFYLATNLYVSFQTNLSRFEKIIIELIFPACAAFSLLGPVFFPKKLWNLCNKILNTRFNIAKHHLTLDPITLFGSRPSDAIPEGLHNLDSSYVFALMRYGILLFALMCIAYMAYIHVCTKEKKYKELAITVSLSVAAIAEPFFVNSSFKNISLLFVGEFIFLQLEAFSMKKPSSFFNKKIGLCTLGEKEIGIPTDAVFHVVKSYKDCIQKKGKIIVFAALCTGILAGTLFAVFADIPTRYYAIHTSTQARRDEAVLLDLQNLPDDFEGKILNYQDAQTLMNVFEGNISSMEYVRGIVSCGLWCSLFCGLFISIFLTCRTKKKSCT